jgi:hypothetical protein
MFTKKKTQKPSREAWLLDHFPQKVVSELDTLVGMASEDSLCGAAESQKKLDPCLQDTNKLIGRQGKTGLEVCAWPAWDKLQTAVLHLHGPAQRLISRPKHGALYFLLF